MKITRLIKKIKLSKKNNPYISISIQTDAWGDAWISGIGNGATKAWAVGTELPTNIVSSSMSNGKEYLNFEMEGDYIDLNNQPLTIGLFLEIMNVQPTQSQPARTPATPPAQAGATATPATAPAQAGVQYPTDEIDPDDIPF